ncbi:MAG TPA: hypothetical protein VJ001_15680, partial [Rhodocyclaceae bacterium]|nr:hypothetical protein [Rhodocyclaceae bacterium]
MTSSFAPIAVRPNYFRLFPKKSNGALFRLGEAAMRMVFKRVKPGFIGIGDLRRQVLTWDERLGRRS